MQTDGDIVLLKADLLSEKKNPLQCSITTSKKINMNPRFPHSLKTHTIGEFTVTERA